MKFTNARPALNRRGTVGRSLRRLVQWFRPTPEHFEWTLRTNNRCYDMRTFYADPHNPQIKHSGPMGDRLWHKLGESRQEWENQEVREALPPNVKNTNKLRADL